MDYLYYILGILIFVAVVLALEGGYLAWNGTRGPEAARIARRLRQMSARGDAQQASMIKQRLLAQSPFWHDVLARISIVDSFDRLLLRSGLPWTVGYLALLSGAGLAIGAAAGALLFSSYIGALALGLAGLALPTLLVRRSGKARQRQIETQLPDALDMMGRALRAGHAFPTSLKMVGDEMNGPIAEEFKTAFDEVNFGMSMQDALTNMANRVALTDMRFFVVAVVIQRETGGNLSELLASISAIMRDRIKLMAQVRVLSAEGRMSAWVLSMLPFAAAGMIQLTNPTFLAVLFTDPMGQAMLGGAAVLMVFGILAMRKIIDIKV